MSPFNTLKRGSRYTFVFGGGVPAVTAVFHEIVPGGGLKVAGTSAGVASGAETHILNPFLVVYARDVD